VAIHNSFAGLIKHIAGAENWYFSKLDLGLKGEQLPDEAIDMLKSVRANMEAQLVKLVGHKRIKKTLNFGQHEKW
jgi:hypothetical protein